jgi:hypothetical protein
MRPRRPIVQQMRFTDWVEHSNMKGTTAHAASPTGRLEQHYPIPDHGLFIADIIQQIAPDVDLHVHRVMSNAGCMDPRAVRGGDRNGRQTG